MPGRCGGTKLDPEHEGECGECQDVVGTTPSGEAVRMTAVGKTPLATTWCRACQFYVHYGHNGECKQCGGTQTEAADEDAKEEDPVRMVGAERAEAAGKMPKPSEWISAYMEQNFPDALDTAAQKTTARSLAIVAWLDEQATKGPK